MINSDVLRGKRCILVARCSSPAQVEQSIDKQLEVGRSYATTVGMDLVDVVQFPGYSASVDLHHDQLLELIDRKTAGEDFNAIPFMAIDRFCRTGPEEGLELIKRFNNAEISIVTVKEGLIEGRYAWLILGLHLDAAQAYVESQSFHVAGGQMKSVLAKRIPHSQRVIYGIDRLYTETASGRRLLFSETSVAVFESS